MQIQITRRFIPANVLNIMLCVVLYVVLWFLPYIIGSEQNAPDKIPTLFLQHYTLWNMPAVVSLLTAMLVSMAIIYRLWITAQEYQIIPARTCMPLLVGALLIAAVDCIHYFDHSYIAFIFIMEAIRQMMNLYNFECQTKAAFNTALLIGAAAMFEPMYIWLILLFIIGLIVYRAVSWRTLTSLVVGLVLVFYMSVSIAWLTDTLPVVEAYTVRFLGFSIPEVGICRWSDIALVVLLSILWTITIFNYIVHRGSYNLYLRLNFSFLSWSFVYIVMLVMFSGSSALHLIPVALALIVLNASLYFTTNQSKMSNITFILTAVALIGYRVSWLLGF